MQTYLEYLEDKDELIPHEWILRWAINNNYVGVAKELLKRKFFNKFLTKPEGHMFLWLALNYGSENMTIALLHQQDIKKLIVPAELFEKAIKKGYAEVVKILIKAPNVLESIIASNNAILIEAIKSGNLDATKLLVSIPEVLKKNRECYNHAFRVACYVGNLEMVMFLTSIESIRAQITINDNEVLILAAKKGHEDVIDFLLQIDDVAEAASIRSNLALNMAINYSHEGVASRLMRVAVVAKGWEDVPHITSSRPVFDRGPEPFHCGYNYSLLRHRLDNYGSCALFCASRIIEEYRIRWTSTQSPHVYDTPRVRKVFNKYRELVKTALQSFKDKYTQLCKSPVAMERLTEYFIKKIREDNLVPNN